MAKDSSIEWTHHTFNPWWGCVKVSPGCQHCYAETFSKRVGQEIWGKDGPRRFFGAVQWKAPIKWNAEATADGERRRVFCASMSDVFEERADLDPWRTKLWELIIETPMLDWLLLTKRPENIGEMVPWTTDWPENVWLGTTVETQKYVDERLPHLLKHKSKVRFLSCEPMLGEVDLKHWIKPNRSKGLHGIDWIIAGGESGALARAMNPDWARKLRDQALSEGIPFHFKQWGQWAPSDHLDPGQKGKVLDLDGVKMIRLKSKKIVDRSLDCTIWDEYPVNQLSRKPSSEKTTIKKTSRSKSTKRKGQIQSYEMFDLIDVDQISSLRRNFTACIVELPSTEMHGREAEIFELVATQIKPLLVRCAFVMVKASSDTCSIAQVAFTNAGFYFDVMLIHARGDFYDPWIVFQTTKDSKSTLKCKKLVFSPPQPSDAEIEFFNKFDADSQFSPQSILREFVKMLCPEPIISHVLVPYFRLGTVIAACKAVGVRSVGYDSKEFYFDEDHFEDMADIIESLTKVDV